MTNKKNKKDKIKYDPNYRFEERANRVIDILRKTNVCTYENLIKYSHYMNQNISANRFKVLEDLKYIKKIQVIDKRTKEVYEAYHLLDRGRTYCRDHIGKPVYASRSDFHDYHQSKFLFENFTVEELETYKHEKELTPPSQTGASVRLYRHMSRPDGQLTRNGEDIFVETITKDYGPDKIKSKITYAEYHCAKCIYNVL